MLAVIVEAEDVENNDKVLVVELIGMLEIDVFLEVTNVDWVKDDDDIISLLAEVKLVKTVVVILETFVS